MAVLEHDGKLLVIDCGVLFPEDHQPGVDLILPGLRLHHRPARRHRGRRPHARPRGPHRRRALPAAAARRTSRWSARSSRSRWSRRSSRSTASRRCTLAVREGQVERLGPFECEFVAVNHSIPDALAVAVRTRAGTVLHTGDFKMDQLPLDGRLTDLRAFARLGEAGVDLFMVDSTNAEVPGFTTPEREIAPVLDRVFAQAERRVIVASFASHVHRVQQVLDTAKLHGRKVALVGRSMVRNMGVAKDLGYLTVPDGVLVDVAPGRRPARRAGRAHVHRLAGRADGGPVPDGEQGPPDPGRPGRHGRARVVAHPGQRERRLPGDQRPGPPRREGRAPGQRPGARLRPRQRRRAPVLLQHRRAAQRHAGARRGAAPASRTPTWRSRPACRASGS